MKFGSGSFFLSKEMKERINREKKEHNNGCFCFGQLVPGGKRLRYA